MALALGKAEAGKEGMLLSRVVAVAITLAEEHQMFMRWQPKLLCADAIFLSPSTCLEYLKSELGGPTRLL